MLQIEDLRQELHKALDDGNTDEILNISVELDKLILRYVEKFVKIENTLSHRSC